MKLTKICAIALATVGLGGALADTLFSKAPHSIIPVTNIPVTIAPISAARAQEPLVPVTIAFISDQGVGPFAKDVLATVKKEGTDLLLIQGGLGYGGSPQEWQAMIDAALGTDFPVLASVGDHDIKQDDKPKDSHNGHWLGDGGYQEILERRLTRVDEMGCDGQIGVQATCQFQGIQIVLSGIGTLPDQLDDQDHVSYLAEAFQSSTARWRICSWHKVQHLIQVGEQKDETGWRVYDTCRRAGAIIATGHQHNYSRTHLMSDFANQQIGSVEDTLYLSPGRSFAFVSGLGGKSISGGGRAEGRDNPWWAKVYAPKETKTSTDRKVDDVTYGALFCTFFAQGQPERADCRFKTIDGTQEDKFTVITRVGGL